MSLEYVVRPFATKKVTPPTRLVESETTVADAVIVVSGAEGLVQKWTLTATQDFNVKDKDTYKEQSRKTTPKRVENPDDPDQYVMVDRIDSMKLRNIYDPTKFREYEFENPE